MPVSSDISVEYMELDDELWAPLSRFNLLRRPNIVFPNNCTLSGRSRRCVLLVVDRPDDFLDSAASSIFSHDGRSADARERNDDDPDEVVCWLWCLSKKDARFICLLKARMLSGEGGPAMAGSRRSTMVLGWCRLTVVETVGDARAAGDDGDDREAAPVLDPFRRVPAANAGDGAVDLMVGSNVLDVPLVLGAGPSERVLMRRRSLAACGVVQSSSTNPGSRWGSRRNSARPAQLGWTRDWEEGRRGSRLQTMQREGGFRGTDGLGL